MSNYPPQPYVLQSGTITPGHGLVWVANGVVEDSGGPPPDVPSAPAGYYFTASGVPGQFSYVEPNVAGGPAILDSYNALSEQLVIPAGSTIALSLATIAASQTANGIPAGTSGALLGLTGVAGIGQAVTTIKNLTLGANLTPATTWATMLGLSSTAYVDGDLLTLEKYAVANDGGGGTFRWSASSTAAPDPGVTGCPTDRTTAVRGEAYGTGNGGTGPYTHTLADLPAIPNTISIVAGLGTAIVDNGAGVLVYGGVIIGSVNYATGAVTFTETVANTQAITVSYNYASAAGRWLRAVDTSDVLVSWFGGITSGADISAAWQAADNYAANYVGRMVRLNLKGLSVINRLPLTLASPTEGDCGDVNPVNLVTFTPATVVDNQAGITLVGNCNYFARINISGPDEYSGGQQSTFFGDWILQQAEFTATISGNTMTVTAITAGTIVVGAQNTNSISGAGLLAQPVGSVCVLSQTSGTTGGVGVYTISMAAQTVSTATTIYQTLLPTMAGIKVARIALDVQTQMTLERVFTQSAKIGLNINDSGGHIRSISCIYQGFIGVFYAQNNGDYQFIDCDLVGSGWSAFGGASSVPFDCRMVAGHVGFSAFGWFQFYSSGVGSGNFGSILLNNTSFEAFGEAAIQTLQGGHVDGGNFSNTGFQSGSYISTYKLGTQLVPTSFEYLFYFGDNINTFVSPSPNSGYGTYQRGNSGYIAYFTTAQSAGKYDFDTLNSLYFVKNGFGYYPRKAVDRFEHDFVRITEQSQALQLAPHYNILKNPEIASNYGTAACTVTVSSLSAVLAGALSGYVIPRSMAEEIQGSNPVVIEIAVTSGSSCFANLNLNLTSWALNRSIFFNCWVAFPKSSTTVAGNLSLYGNSNAIAYVVVNPTSGTFEKEIFLDNRLSDGTNTSPNYFQFGFSGQSGDVLYIICPMLSLDKLQPYNPNPGPTAFLPLCLQKYTVSTLPTGFPSGAKAVVTDATSPTFLGALTGGGTVVTPVTFNGTAWVAG